MKKYSPYILACMLFFVVGFLSWKMTSSTVPELEEPTEIKNPETDKAQTPRTNNKNSVKELSGSVYLHYNTTWKSRTQRINGRNIQYFFGSGNPIEVDKTPEELLAIYKECISGIQNNNCHDRIPYYEKFLATYDDKMNPVMTGHLSRMTPEIEQLIYEFISSPILTQSTLSCGNLFWKDGEEGSLLYPREDMGEVLPENWWRPYNIDIDKILVINPNTGRKELNIDPIWTLNTQIQFPQVTPNTPGNYTNTKLTDCLSRNGQLQPLQKHVNLYYTVLERLWRGEK